MEGTKKCYNILSVVLIILVYCNILTSQITGVKFFLEKQSEKAAIDVYLVIDEGSAKSLRERVQFGSQISLVVPKELTPKIAKSYMPLNDNQEYTGTVACRWNMFSKTISPSNNTECSYISITPELSPSSFYNNLKKGDKIKLFTLEFDGNQDCIEGVRLYENGLDASAEVKGMHGSDYSNAFNLGSIKSVYIGNESSKGLIWLTQKGKTLSSNVPGKEFEWYDADQNTLINTTKNNAYKPVNDGVYYVKVKTGTCTIKSGIIRYSTKKSE